MKARAGIAILGIITVATVVLVALAPWLDPCIGPLRFVNCVDMERSAAPNALAPWLSCPMGVCDFFPSAADRAIRLTAVAFVIAMAAILVSRLASRRRALFGAAAAIATVIVASALAGFIYVGHVA